jgi:hypothetical protein
MIPIPLLALAAMIHHIDPWATFRVIGREAGLSDSQIGYYIRINTRAGWESPERRKR